MKQVTISMLIAIAGILILEISLGTTDCFIGKPEMKNSSDICGDVPVLTQMCTAQCGRCYSTNITACIVNNSTCKCVPAPRPPNQIITKTTPSPTSSITLPTMTTASTTTSTSTEPPPTTTASTTTSISTETPSTTVSEETVKVLNK